MDDQNALLPDIKLRFNIEHPSFEECYAAGYACAMAEGSEERNPYRAGSKESGEWIEGWWAGFYGEAPLYDLNDIIGVESSIDLMKEAVNDQVYVPQKTSFIIKLLEITSVIAVSAFVGYQVLELVA